MSARRGVACALALVMLTGACASGGAARSISAGATTSTTTPLPPPVEVRAEPDTGQTTDPAFTALPGATASYGRLGGATYQIEMPDHWNGDLFMWMHGYEEFGDAAHVGPPDFRSYLIGHGYAWAASSFSSTLLIPGRAADETAALWDHFVAEYRRPRRTFVGGMSMGGWATHVAAERYGNRFDGALALCGAAGTDAGLAISTTQLLAGAYLAGITQAELDSTDVAALIETRIKPAIAAPRAHRRFEDLVVALTGGPRAFGPAGIHREESLNWDRAVQIVNARLGPSRGATLRRDVDGITAAAFNRARLRLPSDPKAIDSFAGDGRLSGRLEMPMVTMHTTGDGQVPIDQAIVLQRIVDDAGRSRKLVQRVVEDPGHCGFTTVEQIDGFRALVDWRHTGRRPAGTNLHTRDLRHLDRTFGLHRAVSRNATVELRGHALAGGQPFDSTSTGAAVLHDGLVTACQGTIGSVSNGRFHLPVLRAGKAAGCGRPGDRVVVWVFLDDTIVHATAAVPWPRASRSPVLELNFDSAHPQGAIPEVAQFVGEIATPSGDPAASGARVEARIEGRRCGVASVRHGGSFVGFIMSVVGPDSIPGCTIGGVVTFSVDGVPVAETVRNDPGSHPDTIFLTLQPRDPPTSS